MNPNDSTFYMDYLTKLREYNNYVYSTDPYYRYKKNEVETKVDYSIILNQILNKEQELERVDRLDKLKKEKVELEKAYKQTMDIIVEKYPEIAALTEILNKIKKLEKDIKNV